MLKRIYRVGGGYRVDLFEEEEEDMVAHVLI